MRLAPGALNTICDVPGIRVGQAEDHDFMTGVTVIVPDEPAVAAVDHRGGGIGARDTILLGPGSVVEEVHAICLSGGSAFGLDAAGGVMHALARDGRGFQIGQAIVPIVPSAIIFDLLFGRRGIWEHPPWWELGLRAASGLETNVALGNAGAGLGATAGPLKGGTGSASLVTPDGTLGALAIVNPVGSTVMPGTDTFWAWSVERNGELGGQSPPTERPADLAHATAVPSEMENTTLVVVATDAALTKDQAMRVAIMAQDGVARAIDPAHGPLDGDTVFVLSTASRGGPSSPAMLNRLGALAAETTARAIARGVFEAVSLAGVPAYREVHLTGARSGSG